MCGQRDVTQHAETPRAPNEATAAHFPLRRLVVHPFEGAARDNASPAVNADIGGGGVSCGLAAERPREKYENQSTQHFRSGRLLPLGARRSIVSGGNTVAIASAQQFIQHTANYDWPSTAPGMSGCDATSPTAPKIAASPRAHGDSASALPT
mmetsp:Transcript_18934/g.58795  ORF Transcript_18934/g.58795 Transcript_18934/m.58795 type:complete len:152 (+) Transcript_18934:309-764(+)